MIAGTVLVLGLIALGYGLVKLVQKARADVNFDDMQDDLQSALTAGYVTEEEFEDAERRE
jgi:hypothetical protein